MEEEHVGKTGGAGEGEGLDNLLVAPAAILERLPDAVVAADRAGRIVFVNALAEELFGYPRNELLGQPVQTLWPARVRERYVRNMALYFATERSRYVTGTVLPVDGGTVAGKPIAYTPEVYPYFFVDLNGNGTADKDESKFPNRYKAWTPRLLKAAYNYQFVVKDPGAYAHNPTYATELLHDSLADLGAKVTVDLAKAVRP